ncbi:hypothetical protein DICPUDRAFT_57581 [Dictyostelium purpureum]|uniref:Uncharacterized protein n=1 Tax=Dictyostelium purpureum TaxID=5786 RepID=F0ZWN3_DICPU|nr:uncharacterized protein DICPUDRAFT_57581 [Dictyostelium purpureum]EGC31661.1 hypothetical protein DICPUDRAFT_57581 [Dictyostelium purpureum]|eukprot:XP_003291827.1 hypothetical protein DICPUDRAFT_57581 [Dictyostelium purpureum]
MSQDIKFTEFLSNTKANANKQAIGKLFNCYQQYVMKKPFSLLIHTMAGLTLFSFIVRHDKINHHKTQPHH